MQEFNNIFEAIVWVQGQVPYLKKDVTIQMKGSSYPAITHDSVTAAIRQFTIKAGVVPVTDVIEHSYQMEGGKTICHVVVQVAYVLACKPDAHQIVVRMPAMAIDFSDKAYGKAVSLAVKNCHLKTFLIETGENEESRIELSNTIEDFQVNSMAKRLADAGVEEEDFVKWINSVKSTKYEALADIERKWMPFALAGILKKEEKVKAAKDAAMQKLEEAI